METIGTVKRSFSLLGRDPIIILFFVLPAMFPIESTITNFLFYYLTLSVVGESGELPSIPSIPPIPFVTFYFIVGFLLGVWASAAAVLKVTELENGGKLGLKEALSKGLNRVPRLVVPAIVGLALYALMMVGMAIAVVPYILTGTPPLAQDAGPSVVVVRVAMGFLFVIGLYFATRLRLAVPACVVENNFGLKRSWGLVKGNWWKLLAILLIFGVMSAIISRIPVVGLFLSDVLVEPVTVVAMTLVYFQLREARPSTEEHKGSL